MIGAVVAGGVRCWPTRPPGRGSCPPSAGRGAGRHGLGRLTALLRDKFNANEILVSLMLVYVATLVLGYLVYGPWKDPMGYNFPQTKTFEKVTQIPRLMGARACPSACCWRWLGRRWGVFCSARGRALPNRWVGLAPRPRAMQAFHRAGAVDCAADFGRHGPGGALEVAGPLASSRPTCLQAMVRSHHRRLCGAPAPCGHDLSAILMSMFCHRR